MDDAATKRTRLEAQLDPEVHALLERAAAIAGCTVADFVVDAARAAARGRVERSDVIRPSREGSELVAHLLLDETSGRNEAMQRGFERRRTLFGLE